MGDGVIELKGWKKGEESDKVGKVEEVGGDVEGDGMRREGAEKGTKEGLVGEREGTCERRGSMNCCGSCVEEEEVGSYVGGSVMKRESEGGMDGKLVEAGWTRRGEMEMEGRWDGHL